MKQNELNEKFNILKRIFPLVQLPSRLGIHDRDQILALIKLGFEMLCNILEKRNLMINLIKTDLKVLKILTRRYQTIWIKGPFVIA